MIMVVIVIWFELFLRILLLYYYDVSKGDKICEGKILF